MSTQLYLTNCVFFYFKPSGIYILLAILKRAWFLFLFGNLPGIGKYLYLVTNVKVTILCVDGRKDEFAGGRGLQNRFFQPKPFQNRPYIR